MTDAVGPLWRASQAFRLITLVYAVSYQIASVPYYSNQRLSWFFVAMMAVWTGVSAMLLSRAAGVEPAGTTRWTAGVEPAGTTSWTAGVEPEGTTRWAVARWKVVAADQLVVIALMSSTRLVAEHDWYSTHQTLPTTLWATNAVISAAILFGPKGGIASGVLLSAASAVVRDQVNLDLWTDATAPVLLSVGLALGLASNTATRAHAELERAARLAAVTEERERLARQVHDGVLQVLALVRRRGREIGGAANELAELAGEQEVALRMLISEQAVPSRAGVDVDLGALLRKQTSTRVSLSAPAEPVLLSPHAAEELSSAVATALSNVALHAGERARAFVLIEDLGETVVVSIRDDGCGIPAGRLAEAEAEGRMGVSKSIVGRIRALGGTAELDTDESGTEWEIRVPRAAL